jgi:hypothetical protein
MRKSSVVLEAWPGPARQPGNDISSGQSPQMLPRGCEAGQGSQQGFVSKLKLSWRYGRKESFKNKGYIQETVTTAWAANAEGNCFRKKN